MGVWRGMRRGGVAGFSVEDFLSAGLRVRFRYSERLI